MFRHLTLLAVVVVCLASPPLFAQSPANHAFDQPDGSAGTQPAQDDLTNDRDASATDNPDAPSKASRPETQPDDDPEPASYPVLSGVGLALRIEAGRILVGAVLPDSPAGESEAIQKGDRILAVEVDSRTIRLEGKTLGDAVSLIRGPVGTAVTLTIERAGADSPSKVTLTRKPLALRGVAPTYQRFIGKPMPDVKLSLLEEADDARKVRLSDHRGQIVVLEFWASWCATCYAPVDRLQTLAKDHPEWHEKVELLTVTADSDLAQAAETIKHRNWNHTRHAALPPDDLTAIGVDVLPVTIIVSPEGRISAMAAAHAIDVEQEVGKLLAAEPRRPAE